MSTSDQRHGVIEALSNAAAHAMAEVCRETGASSAEVMSACFTLLKRMILNTLQTFPQNRTALLDTLQIIMLDLSDPKKLD